MRTYILALTKYGIAGIVIAYTLVAFFLLLKNQDRDIEMRRALSSAELVLMLAFQILSYFTLFVALDNVRYILLCLAHTVVFLGVNLLYQNTFRHAHMPLFNNMCMLISAGIIILSRLDITRALKQFVMVCAGFVIAFALPFFRKKFYLLKKPGYIYAVLGVGALSIVMLLGATTLGANITYTIFGLTFQPSEFVKILYLLFLASTLRNVQDLKELAVITAFAAAHVLVLIGSKDLGSGLIFYMVFIFMAYMALDEWIILAGGFGAMAFWIRGVSSIRSDIRLHRRFSQSAPEGRSARGLGRDSRIKFRLSNPILSSRLSARNSASSSASVSCFCASTALCICSRSP